MDSLQLGFLSPAVLEFDPGDGALTVVPLLQVAMIQYLPGHLVGLAKELHYVVLGHPRPEAKLLLLFSRRALA